MREVTRGDLPAVKVLGRPFKPLALAVMLSLFVIAWFGMLTETGPLDGSIWSDIVGAAALVAGFVMLGGFACYQCRFARYGLIIASGVWAAVAACSWMLYGLATFSAWFSLCWVVATVGATLLEMVDDAGRWG